MLAKMNSGINSAYQRLQVISQDDLKRMEYEARMKAVRDQNQLVLESREEGGDIRALAIAKKMLSEGFDVGVISRMTNLTEKQIRTLEQ